MSTKHSTDVKLHKPDEPEVLDRLAQAVQSFDEEGFEPDGNRWLFSFVGLLTVLLGMFVMIYAMQVEETDQADSELSSLSDQIEPEVYQKVVFENQNLHNDRDIASAQIDDLLQAKNGLENQIKVKDLKIRELEERLKKVKPKK